MSKKIFISYRRSDSPGTAGRLHDFLSTKFGDEAVFMDVDSIELGWNFKKEIDEAVAKCGVLLAVIGPSWLNELKRRLDEPNDHVRIEISAALQRNIPVIPILLDGTSAPKTQTLPKDLEELSLRNGLSIRNDSFRRDIEPLEARLRRLFSRDGDILAKSVDSHLRDLLGREKTNVIEYLGEPETTKIDNPTPGARRTNILSWLSYQQSGLSVSLSNTTAKCIFFYAQGVEGYQAYKMDVAAGLAPGMTRAQIEARFGRPTSKDPSLAYRVFYTEIIPGYRITIAFDTDDQTDINARAKMICLQRITDI
jgi:TIR domain